MCAFGNVLLDFTRTFVTKRKLPKPGCIAEKSQEESMLGKTAAIMILIVSLPANAQNFPEKQCPLKTLAGIEAQELMVKGVIMHTEFEKKSTGTLDQHEISLVHTLRADWAIWICIQSLIVHQENPQSLTLLCTRCEYD